jgi:hypothetical protein
MEKIKIRVLGTTCAWRDCAFFRDQVELKVYRGLDAITRLNDCPLGKEKNSTFQ